MTAPPELCALILAAGEGRRLRPITATVPKALCPVGNVVLLDRALGRLARHALVGTDRVAVNVSYLAEQVSSHVAGRAHISAEAQPLGTAGAVAHLRDWVDGRPLLVGNADAYLAARTAGPDLDELWAGWDGTTVRVLGVPAARGEQAEFGRTRFAGFSLLPAGLAALLPQGRSELVLEVWRPAERAGRLEVVEYDGFYLDTGTPTDYLRANLHAAGDGSLVAADAIVTGSVRRSVIGAGARVHGSALRCVVLPGGRVDAGEALVDAVRVGRDVTVPAAATVPATVPAPATATGQADRDIVSESPPVPSKERM